MVAFGMPQDIMILQIINPKTSKPIGEGSFKRYFHGDLIYGKHKMNQQVAKALFHNAVRNLDTKAQIFWLKTRAGWREPPKQIELDGVDFTLDLGEAPEED